MMPAVKPIVRKAREIRVEELLKGVWIAHVKGDKSKPRLEGRGLTWQAAAKDLLSKMDS